MICDNCGSPTKVIMTVNREDGKSRIQKRQCTGIECHKIFYSETLFVPEDRMAAIEEEYKELYHNYHKRSWEERKNNVKKERKGKNGKAK